jgi:nucleoid-associated protein YgaU
MFMKGSRYDKALQFEPTPAEETIFKGISPRQIDPAVGVIEHVVTTGERLDLLAGHYYNHPRLWWRIVDANPDILFGGDMFLEHMVGQAILIPKARD